MPIKLISMAMLVMAGNVASPAFAQDLSCGELANSYGPFDYRNPQGRLAVVEDNHFKAVVEVLAKGMTSSTPGGDIDYTLRAFPNHHRALLSTIRLGDREKTTKPQGMNYTVECWLERAVRFKGDDAVARMIYAGYLAKIGKKDQAKAQLARTEQLAESNPFTQYNIGLVYLEMNEFELALKQAHLAEEMGFPRTELRDALVKAGKWADRPASRAEPTASSPAAPVIMR